MDSDAAAGKLNTLEFKAGVLTSDVTLARSGTSLVVSISGTSDTVTIQSFFESESLANVNNPIQQFKFADAAIWSLATIQNKLPGGGVVADDVMVGTVGADNMAGGLGNDTYVVNHAGDVVTEQVNEGTDTVQSSLSYILGANVEKLVLTGAGVINGTGNALANMLTGNAASNNLYGGAGNDILDGAGGPNKMYGGVGDDTYYVAKATDGVFENLNEGMDLILSTSDYELGLNAENLTLLGTAAISALGNTIDNVLTGNVASNTLTGRDGNDTLIGGLGADTLVGGSGNDTYLLGRGDGADLVTENDAAAGNTDVAVFGASIATDQLWFRQVGNDLEVSVIGTGDKLNIGGWYLGNQYHVEQFKTSDGHTLLDSQVQNLVQAMAGFAPPAAGQTTLPAGYASNLAPTLAANWH
ncbi:MAG: hypothetical protein JWP29_3775 [Rhodoferax sp.]|nr:hypothetical protein [Rhodoferax sp.]